MAAPLSISAAFERRPRKPLHGLASISIVFSALAAALAVYVPASSAAPIATTNTLTLRVQSARAWIPAGLHQGDLIPPQHYHWLVVQNDVGDPTKYNYASGNSTGSTSSNYDCTPAALGGDPNYPANCQWPSLHSFKGGVNAVGGPNGPNATDSEIVAQGDGTMLNTTQGIDTSHWPQNSHNPNRSYMISVTADGYDVPGCTKDATHTCHVDGFKIDGAYFSLPLTGSGLVTVSMQPYPLPLATVRMKVWNDLDTNGAYDTGEPYLQGFEGHISDVDGIVTNDYWGNPLCTAYQHDASGLFIYGADGKPAIQQIGGHCYSDANGVITIPYLPQNHYTSTVVAPAGQTWYQSTSLDGDIDWDTWAIQGWDGYDPEFIQGKENWPFAEFGFVKPMSNPNLTNAPANGSAANTGSVTGQLVAASEFVPNVGAYNLGANNGLRIIGPLAYPQIPKGDATVVAMIDNNANDFVTYVGTADPATGKFTINNIPDGNYTVETFDAFNLWLMGGATFSIVNGNAVNVGNVEDAAWFSYVHGKVCFDTNRNGKCDAGERGIPNLTLNLLGRDNTLQQYGDNSATTDANGNYVFRRAYPIGRFVVEQGYWEGYYTVGVTDQTDTQTSETTTMANGGFVDLSVMNQVGHDARIDWAVHTYETDPSLGPTTGGIVGEMVNNVNRFTLDPRFTASMTNEPGISGIPVHLYAPVKCSPTQTPPAGANCTQVTTAYGSNYYLTSAADGSVLPLSDASGNPIDLNDPYISETWHQPVNCVSRGFDGTPTVQQVVPPTTGGHQCLEGPLMGNQVGDNSQTSQPDSITGAMFVNGNYGFTQVKVNPTTGATLAAPATIPAGDYIIAPEIPKDPATGKLIYEATKEEDLNINSGDTFFAPGETPNLPPAPAAGTVPNTPAPQIPPPPCVGPLHSVHVVSDPTQAHFDPLNPSTTSGVYNPDFAAAGGSPFEGQQRPMCTSKMVTVRAGRSTTPNFYWHTQNVPLPSRIFGLVTDDLNLSVNPKELNYGEKYGLPNIPIGVYDFDNKLITTVYSDPNGEYEVLLPSTSTFNCPFPNQTCPGIYRFMANDPGQPGHPNPGFNPGYRTLSTLAEAYPGMSVQNDLAPMPTTLAIENPGVQFTHAAACLLNDPSQATAPKVPGLYSVNKPYVLATTTGTARNFTITGQYFGATQGTGSVTLDGISMPIVPGSWSDRQIVFTVPSTFAAGPHQLLVTSANGQRTVDGLTFHVLGTGYSPTVFEVGPGRTGTRQYNSDTDAHAVQHALDAAASAARALVVVYPGTPGGGPYGGYNPLGAYYENLIIHSPVKLQGVGPGGVYADGSYAPGTVLDGLGFGNDGARDTAWENTLTAAGTIMGPGAAPIAADTVAVPHNEVILAIANSATQYGVGYKGAIDGLLIQNGDLSNFPYNAQKLNYEYLGETGTTPATFNTPANPDQGGGIVALASTRYLQITNNVIRSNTGGYGGAIRMGTPNVGDNNLDGARISYNRILNNGGVTLAGAIGLFTGTRGYEVSHNDLCGNFSNEYGGGISHFGLSGASTLTGAQRSTIHDNRIYFNGAYDEGAGIIIAGEQPTTPTAFSAGAGAVNIYNNLIQGNMANDDGGGLRFLEAGNFPYNVYNNMIVNNVSTHEGGGVSIANAPDVRFYNNTVMKNLTTATAQTSNGQPDPAGLSTSLNDPALQRTLPGGAPNFSNPLMFNNIFWDNRSGHWDGNNIVGIGGLVWQNGQQVADPTPINYWDMGVVGPASGQLSPTNSIMEPTANGQPNPFVGNPATTHNITSDPQVRAPYDLTVTGLPWTGNPRLIAPVIVAADVPVTIMGDYHLAGTCTSTTSPANNAGASGKSGVGAPATDIDGNLRPSCGGYEIGAHEIQAPTPVDDDFNRPDSTLLGNATHPWAGDTNTTINSPYQVINNAAWVQFAGSVWWQNSPSGFGANQEAYFNFTEALPDLVNEQGLLLKLNNQSPSSAGSQYIEVAYDATTNSVVIKTKTAGSTTPVTVGTIPNVTFNPGDWFAAEAHSDGTVVVYQNLVKLGSANVSAAGAWTTTGGGNIGVKYGPVGVVANPNDAKIENFGGGTLP